MKMEPRSIIASMARAATAAVAAAAAVFGIVALSGTVPSGASASAAVVCSVLKKAPPIEAVSAYVYDIERDAPLYEKEPFQQMPFASLTKLMTAMVASEILDGKDTVVVLAAALEAEGDSGLFAGEAWRMQDLVDFTLITSANDGALALAFASAGTYPFESEPKEFVRAMNEKARALGLSQSYFLNPTGLDVSTTTAGAYGSARDVALLSTYAYREHPSVFAGSSAKERIFTSLSGFEHKAAHTSTLAGVLPGEAIVKTGFTDLAGGNLVIVVEPLLARPVAIAVLGSSREGRDRDVKTLYEYAENALKRATYCESL